MIKINLFAACSQDPDDLKTKKEIIKKQCQKLNKEYAEKIRYEDHSKIGASSGQENDNVDSYTEENVPSIIPVTYDDPERRKEVHESYIKNKADIVIFLIGDKIDASLEKNLAVAVQQSKKTRGPELLVYFKNDALWDKLKNILGKDGRIYCMPKKDEEFEKNVEWMLRDHIRKYNKNQHFLKRIKILGRIITALLLVLGFCSYLYKIANQDRLLIVGSGSARSYIEDSLLIEHSADTSSILSKYREKVLAKNYWLFTALSREKKLSDKFWLYAPMPSGDSYRIIAEETIKNFPDYKNRPYYPIVISAQRANPSDFKRNLSDTVFAKTGIVIGIHLVDDWLVVYGSKNAIESSNFQSDTIGASALNSIIAKQVPLLFRKDFKTLDTLPIIYTTSKNSGTLNTYLEAETCGDILREYLRACDSLKSHHFFSDIDTLSRQNPGRDWIALGSHYYFPKKDKDTVNDKDEDILQLTLLNNENNIQIKPIYVYFMLYNNGSDSLYVLPKATKEFLKKINLPNNTIDSINNPSIISSIKNDTTILYDTIFKFYKANNE